MKHLFSLTLILCVLSLYSFKTFNYSDYMPEDYAELIQADYLFTTTSSDLKVTLKNQLTETFDEIERIDASYAKKQNVYFYTIFGKKDNTNTFELVEVTKVDLDQEKFPYLLNGWGPGAYRKSYSSHPRACGPICKAQTTNCIGFRCVF